VAADPDDPACLAHASRIAAARGDAAEALRLARRRAEVVPEDPAARASYQELAAAAAGDAEIESVISSLVAGGTTPAGDFLCLGTSALLHARAAVALRVAAAGVAAWPDDDELWLLRCRALLATGGARAAESQIVGRFGAAPESASAREILAWSRGSRGARTRPSPRCPRRATRATSPRACTS